MVLFRHIFFVMSLSGSLVVLLYWLIHPVSRRWFPHGWRKKILQLALFFYLFPVPYFKYIIIKRVPIFDFIVSRQRYRGVVALEDLPFRDPSSVGRNNWILDPAFTINRVDGTFFAGSQVIFTWAVTACLALIAAAVMLRRMRAYRRACRAYSLEELQREVPPWLSAAFEEAKRELKVKGRVSLILSEMCDSPMTMGFFSPVIVFPTPEKLSLGPEEARYILKHELFHIKHRDIFTKFLALLAIALHWYNPFCYLLYREICVVCELDCDYGVVRDGDEVQRKQYSYLILDVARAAGKEKRGLAAGLSGSGAAALKRRLTEIKFSGSNIGALACLAIAAFGLAGTTATFVYDTPLTRHDPLFNADSKIIFTEGFNCMEEAEQFPYDYFFTDEAGTVFSLEERPIPVPCVHDYVDGVVTDHQPEVDGGCVTVKTEAQRCTACGGVRMAEVYISRGYCNVCPHKNPEKEAR